MSTALMQQDCSERLMVKADLSQEIANFADASTAKLQEEVRKIFRQVVC